MRPVHPVALVGATAVSISLLAGCGGDGEEEERAQGAAAASATEITATDTSCEVAKTELTAGTTKFNVTNNGSKVTEVYFYAPGDKVVTERENIEPGDSAEVTVQLSAGKYQIACKPGMTGDGIRQDITVTGRATLAADPRLSAALTEYRAYVNAQVDDTIVKTKEFAAAVKAGDIAEAKRLYAPSRVGWERVEPVAESFGDLDPRVDAREADLEAGDKWTGWHRLEKALWQAKSLTGQEQYADRLLADLDELKSKVSAQTLDPPITPASMANGAKELLDEVATGKVTGEEEAFSHTDLVDFKANVDGAQRVYELLKPVVSERDAALAQTLDQEFADVQNLLAKYEKGDGYVAYNNVGEAERKELSDAVNALGEPLSKLAGVVAQ